MAVAMALLAIMLYQLIGVKMLVLVHDRESRAAILRSHSVARKPLGLSLLGCIHIRLRCVTKYSDNIAHWSV